MTNPAHYVAVIGGAVSGSETAFQFANRGIKVAVIDQLALPYGKIEDGLPKWHAKLRDKEEARIDQKILHENIEYIPNVRLGGELSFEDLTSWGFSAIVLATGAFSDRPLPIKGIDQFVNKGFYYQNPFFLWYNHFHEPNYSGVQHDIKDGSIVVGGGLASLDVIKACMIELVKEKLQEKGHNVNMFTLDRGISKVLDDLGYTLEDLGLKGCKLFYRRRMIDMPVSPGNSATPEEVEKTKAVREKILNNFTSRYLFEFYECHVPVDFIEDDGKLGGLVFQKTEVVDGKAVPIEGSEVRVEAPLVISSIGSIPELLDGIPSEWQMFKISEVKTCKISGYDNVFAVGNAVTGQGNIKESMKHGKELSQRIMDDQLGWKEEDFHEFLRTIEKKMSGQVAEISKMFVESNLLPAEKVDELNAKVKELQKLSGYSGDYLDWREKNIPVRLESILGITH